VPALTTTVMVKPTATTTTWNFGAGCGTNKRADQGGNGGSNPGPNGLQWADQANPLSGG